MQINDDFLAASLYSLYCCDENKNDLLPLPIPFGNIAFIKERFWKFSGKYREPASKRSSHPGLSLSSKNCLLAFGTSKTTNRERNRKDYFLVYPSDCPILKKQCLFITSIIIPGDQTMIDRSKTSYEPLSDSKLQELKNAGFR